MRSNCLLAIIILLLFFGQEAVSSQSSDLNNFPVPPPPLNEDYYPCMDNCHGDMETDPTPNRELEEHQEIKLHHSEQFRWCLDCHDADDRDKFRLQSGEKVDFEHSYRLCGQCHGAKYRSWREGIHGKRTGFWNGKKQYLLCVHCHDPHSPRFKPIQPEPPPLKPGHQSAVTHKSDTHDKKTNSDATENHHEREK